MVHKNLESLKIDKLPRQDVLSTRILKELACVMAGPLIIMFKKSLKQLLYQMCGRRQILKQY